MRSPVRFWLPAVAALAAATAPAQTPPGPLQPAGHLVHDPQQPAGQTAAAQPVTGTPNGPATDPSGKAPDLAVPVGQAFDLRPTTFPGDLSKEHLYVDRPDMLAGPAVLDKAKGVFTLTGAKLGFVRVTFLNPDKAAKGEERFQKYVVQIVPDVVYLNRLVRARFPTANLNVVAAGDNVLFVDGTVDNPNDVIEVDRLLNRYFTGGVVNNLRVGGVMQVQLEVVIARVDRSELRRLGVNVLGASQGVAGGTQVGNLINTPPFALSGANALGGGNTFSPIGTGGPVLNGSATAFFGVAGNSASVYGFVEALKQQNVAKILANPTLVTLSGRPADFLVGGEQPIPTAISLGVPSVTFKPFGTRLSFLPTVLGDGRIRLDVVPEVSTTNFANSIAVAGGGGQIPQFITQRLHAVVELQSGQTLCLGGLLQTEQEGQVDKVPVLGSLPLVGAAFRRVRYRTVESELLVVVTPRLFDPLRGCQVPAVLPGQETFAPTDPLLFGKGKLEGASTGAAGLRTGDGLGGVAPPVPLNPAYPVVPAAPAGKK